MSVVLFVMRSSCQWKATAPVQCNVERRGGEKEEGVGDPNPEKEGAHANGGEMKEGRIKRRHCRVTLFSWLRPFSMKSPTIHSPPSTPLSPLNPLIYFLFSLRCTSVKEMMRTFKKKFNYIFFNLIYFLFYHLK